MDTPTFKATIYYIHPELINQLNTTFKGKNFYHKIMTLPRKGYHNPDYRQKMNNLQQKLWNDVLLQLKDLFEVDSVYQIEDTYKDYIEKFITKYYEPAEDLKKEIELEAPTVFKAHLIARNNTLSEREEQLNTFTNGVKIRIRTSLEREAIKINRESKILIDPHQQEFTVPNQENLPQIKFTLEFK